MKKWLNILVFALWTGSVAHASSAANLPPTDADENAVVFNQKQIVTVVLGCTSDTQTECRAASYYLDPFRGLKDFRLIVVVDLRDSLGGFVKDYVRHRMRNDLDTEALRLKPLYLKNKNLGNPRNDLCAVPDFSGDICKSLGWIKSIHTLQAIVFDKEGHEIARWDNLRNYGELEETVAKALHR